MISPCRTAWRLLAMMVLLCPRISAAQGEMEPPLYLAEVMASNRGTLWDGDEEASDWIEIHHRGTTSIDLTGYHLTDDRENLEKWSFPGVVLAPDERLVVFASGKDRRSALAELHTNFGLNEEGEYVALVGPDGAVVSEFAFPSLEDDESFGLAAEVRPLTVIETGSPCRWQVPFGSRRDLSWTELDFDDSRWFNGVSGIGYDFGLDYHEWIRTDVSFDMAGFATSAQIRFGFEVPAPEAWVGMRLHLRFDDGFAAFVNGERVAAVAAPEVVLTDSRATSDRMPDEAVRELTFNLDHHLDLLVPGTNVLAIQGLDVSPSSGDFLIHPRLELLKPVESPTYGVMDKATPGAPNGQSFAGRVAPVTYSQAVRFHEAPFSLVLETVTPGAAIYYSFDGSVPSPEGGLRYEGPIAMEETLSVRARAYREDLLPSPVRTRSFVFVEELAGQNLLNQSIVGPDREAVEAGLRSGLPMLALAVDSEVMFGDGGIDTIPEQRREVPVSLEYFSEGQPEAGFQIDAGLAIHGGNARGHPKKPFRLFFRRQYGAARLEYPLFEDSPVASFNQLILRAGGHDSWSISPDFGSSRLDLPVHATYLRDQFLRRTEREMGALSPNGRYVHLLINGFYWGLYDLHERPDASFFKDHLGGRESDWDVLHHTDSFDEEWALVDGSDAHWESLHRQLREGLADSAGYAALLQEVDLEGLMDSLIVRMWSGDYDWAGPIYWLEEEVHFFRNKNWYAGRRRGAEPGRYRFFAWDAEMSMGSHLLFNVFGQGVEQRVVNFDLTAVSDPGTPAGLHGALRFFPEYRRLFADRVQRWLVSEEGALAPAAARARLEDMRGTLDPVMIGESARWGDLHSFRPPFTRETAWRPEMDWLRDTFIPQRGRLMVDQLRARDLFPGVEAPRLFPRGSDPWSGPQTVRLELPDEVEGFYTLDGSDPAASVEFSREVLVSPRSEAHYLMGTAANQSLGEDGGWRIPGDWEEPDRWTASTASVGYDEDPEGRYARHYESEIQGMRGVASSLWLRIPFEVTAPESLDVLVLRAKFDDAVAAFINGVPVVSVATPEVLGAFSEAEFARPDEDAVYYRDFDISSAVSALREGRNLLAVQVLNERMTSSDLLFTPQLIGIDHVEGPDLAASARPYDGPLLLPGPSVVKARARSSSGEWSALTEARFGVGVPPDPGSLRISEIHYHPAVSGEVESRLLEFIEVTNVGQHSLALEEVAFVEGIRFVFSDRQLAPGEHLLVVSDREAFLAHYGEARETQIAGEFSRGTQLSNGGELITVVDRNRRVIESVEYDDRDPWPQNADGGGGSLERLDPRAPAWGRNWRVSGSEGGSPGEERPRMTYALWREQHFGEREDGAPMGDPDLDGRVNLLEYYSGTDPLRFNAESAILLEASMDGASMNASVERNPEVTDVIATWEVSSDMSQWQDERGVAVSGEHEATLRLPVSAVGPQWIRLRLTLEGGALD